MTRGTPAVETGDAPTAAADRLLELEQLARYRWAAQVASGRRILDAGCGEGLGSRLLAEAGAREVVGIDTRPAGVPAAAPDMPPAVELRAGDLRHLDLDDDRFDLVVCFGAMESAADPATVLDELVRVLAPGGLLMVSASAPATGPGAADAAGAGLDADALRAQLSARLRHCAVMTQRDYLVSTVAASPALSADGGAGAWPDPPAGDAGAPAPAAGSVVVAGDGSLPDLDARWAITAGGAVAAWLGTIASQQAALAARDLEIRELSAQLQERGRLAELLTAAEQRLASVPELTLRISELEADVAAARRDAEAAREEAQRLDQMLMYGRRMLRYVRPLINPLRRARRRLRA